MMDSPPAPFRVLPSGSSEVFKAMRARWTPGDEAESDGGVGAATPVAADAHGVEWRVRENNSGYCGLIVFMGILAALAWTLTPRTFEATIPVLLLRSLPVILLAWVLFGGLRTKLAHARTRMRLLFEPERLHLVRSTLFSSHRNTFRRDAIKRIFLIHAVHDSADLSGWFVIVETEKYGRHPFYHHTDREPARWLADQVAALAMIAVTEEKTRHPIYEWVSAEDEATAFDGVWRDAPCPEPDDIDPETEDESALERPAPPFRPLCFSPLSAEAEELTALPRGWGPDENKPFPVGSVAYRMDGRWMGWGCVTFLVALLGLAGWALLENTREFFDPVSAVGGGLLLALAVLVVFLAIWRGGRRVYLVLTPDALWHYQYRFHPKPGRRLRRDTVTTVALRCGRDGKNRQWTVRILADGEKPLDLIQHTRVVNDARWLAMRVAAWAGVRPGLDGDGVLSPSSPLFAKASDQTTSTAAAITPAPPPGESTPRDDDSPFASHERLMPDQFTALEGDELSVYWRRVAPANATPPAPGAVGLVDGTPHRLAGEGGYFSLLWVGGITCFTILLIPAWLTGNAHPFVPLFLLPFWLMSAFIAWRMIDLRRHALIFVFDGDRLRIVGRRIRQRFLLELDKEEITEITWRPPTAARRAWMADIQANGGAVSFLSGFKNGWRLVAIRRDGQGVPLMEHAFPILSTQAAQHPPWTWLGERIASWAGVPFAPLRPGQATVQAEWDEAIPPCFEALPPGSSALANVTHHLPGSGVSSRHPATFGFRYRPFLSFLGKVGLTLFCGLWVGFVMYFMGGEALKAFRGEGAIMVLIVFPLFALAGVVLTIYVIERWFKRVYFLFEPDRLHRVASFWGMSKTTLVERGSITTVVRERKPPGRIWRLLNQGSREDWMLRVYRREGVPVDLLECESANGAESGPIVWFGQQVAVWAEAPFEDRLSVRDDAV